MSSAGSTSGFDESVPLLCLIAREPAAKAEEARARRTKTEEAVVDAPFLEERENMAVGWLE